jgi:hypothetical protein
VGRSQRAVRRCTRLSIAVAQRRLGATAQAGWDVGVGRCGAFPQVRPVLRAVSWLDTGCFEQLPNKFPTLSTVIGEAARCFFTRALATTKVVPVEVITDKAAVYPHVLDELAPGAWHCTELYANNRMEADHGQLKRRLRPMRGLKTDHGARIIVAGHAFIQNIRRGHYELGVDEAATLRVAAAFDELTLAI